VQIGGNGGGEVVISGCCIDFVVAVVQVLGCSSVGGSELHGPGVLLSVAGVGNIVVFCAGVVDAGIILLRGLVEGSVLWTSLRSNFWDQ